MKPILYWTFTAQFGFYNLKLIGVTSEGPRGRVNGRFETKEAALAIKDQLQ